MGMAAYELALLDLFVEHWVSNPSLLAEEVVEVIEAGGYVIVHQSQVRDREELLRAIRAVP